MNRSLLLCPASACNANLTGFRGVIESPNWPAAPPRRSNCTWVITVSPGNTVNISFSHMDLSYPLRAPAIRVPWYSHCQKEPPSCRYPDGA